MAVARLVALFAGATLALAACGSQADADQIKAVIEKADHEQEDAFAARDPAIMADSNTAKNFATMARTNDEFAAQGIVGIRLTKVEWGDVSVSSSTTATAVNWETWEQTDSGGNVQSSREHEVYTMLKVGDGWKIDQIDYPDEPSPSDSGSPSMGPSPAPS